MILTTAATTPLTVSIILAAAPIVISLAALVLGKRQQTATLQHEQKQNDLAEARRVLGSAAEALATADDSRRDFIGSYHDRDKRKALGAAGKVLDATAGQIAIRFGRNHEVTKTFRGCASALLKIFAATVLEDDIQIDLVKSGHEQFQQRSAEFIDAATTRAGVDLPARAD